MQLFLIRHGETETNVRGLTHAKDDAGELNATGIGQARKLADFLKPYNIQKLYASSEKRAAQTADIIAEKVGLNVTVISELAERDWGVLAGKPWAEIEAVLKPMSLQERYTFKPDGGESWQQMERRLAGELEAIAAKKDEAVAIILHGGALRALMPIIKQQPLESSFKYDFKNASVTLVEYTDGSYSVVFENRTDFLE